MTILINKKILVIEDDSAMLNALADTLRAEVFTVFTAGDGEKGLAVALKEHPALILLDLVLPKMDGMALMKKLRQDEWGKSVPIIIVTNLDSNNDILKGVMEDKPAYYLTKAEFTPKAVVTKVEEILSAS